MNSQTSLRVRGSRPGRRLVEEQDSRTGDQARADVQAPPHPARVGLDQPVASVREVEPLEHVLGAAATLALVEVVPQTDQLEVLAAGQQLVDRRVLAGEPDYGAQWSGVGNDVVAGDTCATAVRLEQRRQDPHKCRLPGSVGAEQSKHLGLLGYEIDAGERNRRSEALRDALHFDRRHADPQRVVKRNGTVPYHIWER
jgi:hypothetical protein